MYPEAMRLEGERTGAAENAGDLDELDGDLGGIHGGFWPGQLVQSVAIAGYGGRRAYMCLSLVATEGLARTVSWWRCVVDAGDFGGGEVRSQNVHVRWCGRGPCNR